MKYTGIFPEIFSQSSRTSWSTLCTSRSPLPVQPASGRIVTGLDGDERAEVVAITRRKVQADVAAHRTAHHRRPIQVKLAAERDHEVGVELGGELVLLFPPALGRNRLAVTRE